MPTRLHVSKKGISRIDFHNLLSFIFWKQEQFICKILSNTCVFLANSEPGNGSLVGRRRRKCILWASGDLTTSTQNETPLSPVASEYSFLEGGPFLVWEMRRCVCLSVYFLPPSYIILRLLREVKKALSASLEIKQTNTFAYCLGRLRWNIYPPHCALSWMEPKNKEMK